MAASVTVMEIGFLQKCEPWRLLSPQFPSKVGGRPAWLGEVGLPGLERLQCGVCMKPLAFLLQVYAPCTGSFHRTIFLFICRDPTCHRAGERRCYRVFRNQLPRKNDTYSYGPPPDSPPPHGEHLTSFQLKCGLSLCRVCGCLGPKSCSRCHKVNYCDRLHQVMDWKVQHKQLCGKLLGAYQIEVADHGFLFPEYELVTEPEELDSDTSLNDDSTLSRMDEESMMLNASSNLDSWLRERPYLYIFNYGLMEIPAVLYVTFSMQNSSPDPQLNSGCKMLQNLWTFVIFLTIWGLWTANTFGLGNQLEVDPSIFFKTLFIERFHKIS